MRLHIVAQDAGRATERRHIFHTNRRSDLISSPRPYGPSQPPRFSYIDDRYKITIADEFKFGAFDHSSLNPPMPAVNSMLTSSPSAVLYP
jgi:hypothetical protein